MPDMLCPVCHEPSAESKVTDTRPSKDRRFVIRERRCSNGGHKFTTYEYPFHDVKVRKRNQSLETFKFEKIYDSLHDKTFDGTGVSDDEIGKLASAVTAHVIGLRKEGEEITSADIGQAALEELFKRHYEVAYNRYKAYHSREYKTIAEYKAMLDDTPAVRRERKPREKKRGRKEQE